MPRIRFNPEINLGHLVQLFGFVLAVVGLYYAMDKRVTILERGNATQASQLTELVRIVDENSKSIVRLVTLQEQDRGRPRVADTWKRKGDVN